MEQERRINCNFISAAIGALVMLFVLMWLAVSYEAGYMKTMKKHGFAEVQEAGIARDNCGCGIKQGNYGQEKNKGFCSELWNIQESIMAKYRKISPRILNDAKVRKLTDKGKLVFLFLLTHPAMTPFGAIRANAPGLAYELG